MNAGPDVERLIAGWLQEEAPGRAPDRILELAGRTIDRTNQRRFAAWRPTTMFDRLAVAGVSAVFAIGVLALGASLMRTSDSAAAPCPATRAEAEAIDTFVPGLSAADRTWGIPAGVPDRVGPGLIAAFTYDEVTDERALIAIDPVSGQRCILIRNVSGPVQSPGGTQLDWSPSGDALAIGLAGDEGPGGQGPGQLMIWTPDRLVRIWTGEGTPYLDWSPDGRSVAVWSGASNAVSIQADGSADRTFEVRPVAAGGPNWNSGLSWSPDGSRWVITTYAAAGRPGPTTVSMVDIGDGRVTPIDLGIDWLGAIEWIDDQRMLLQEWEEGTGSYRYLDVPVSAPDSFAVVRLPEAVLGGSFVAFSPDHTRAAFVSQAGQLSVGDVTSDTPPAPVVVDARVGDVENHVFWSPDGAQLLFHTNETVEGQSVVYRMWIVNADGSGLREVGRGNVIAVDDPWQPLAVQER